MAETGKIVVRFAPSPTGYLHLGSARTALFNWLYARREGGKFLLRIEDTDKERSKDEFLKEILEDLKWLGMDFDGELFFQSKRLSVYKEYAERLLDKELAYKEGEAIIFKVEKSRIIKINDAIHGEIAFNTDEIKDQVLIKSDGFPAYNFACAVDDHDMGITLAIRGDDHISNTPKQILIYEALGLKAPNFAHMPLLMAKDGSKLSKRHGGVSVAEYRKGGYLPEALSNYLLLLGWSPGEGREIVSLEEAKKIFRIEDLGGAQAKFDIEKLRWINGEYIRTKSVEELTKLLEARGAIKNSSEQSYLAKIVELYKNRMRALGEFTGLTACFFADDFPMDKDAEKKLNKHLKDDKTKKAFTEFRDRLRALKEFNKDTIEKTCRDLAEKHGVKPAGIIHPARSAISGKTQGAGLFEMMEALGKERVIARLDKYCPVV